MSNVMSETRLSFWCTEDECDFADPSAALAKAHKDAEPDHVIAVEFQEVA